MEHATEQQIYDAVLNAFTNGSGNVMRKSEPPDIPAMESRMNKAKYLKTENKKWPVVLQCVPREEWPHAVLPPERMPVQVWRSKGFLVQEYMDKGFARLSVLRTELGAGGRFRENITWEELMRLKAQCGYQNAWAIEVFPPDAAVVNVQNMRHLFILPDAPPYGWNNTTAHMKG